MNRLDCVLDLERLLVETGIVVALPLSASAGERLALVSGNLLRLGEALRRELPDPSDFIHLATCATVELARLVTPWTEPRAALSALRRLQHHRWGRGASDKKPWTSRRPEAHLRRAFWNLAGVATELGPAGPGRDSLAEHAADAANYLALLILCSGAWDLLGGRTTTLAACLPALEGAGRASCAPEHHRLPGAGNSPRTGI